MALPSPVTYAHGQAYFERIRHLLGSDPASASRLARHHKIFGAFPESRAWAYRTRAVWERLQAKWQASVLSFDLAAQVAATPQDRLIFPIGAIDSLGRLGKVDEACSRADRLAKKLIALGLRDEAGMAQLNAANALLWHDRYGPALKRYTKALSLLDPDRQPSLVASANLGLSTSELFGGHPRRALTLAQAAQDRFNELEFPAYTNIAKANQAQALHLLGRSDEAAELFLELRGTFETDSLDFGRTEEFLGDAYLRMNLWREASDAYSSALTIPEFQRSKGNVANAELGLGMSHLSLQQPEKAEAHLRRAHSQFKRFGNEIWGAVALIWLARCHKSTGHITRAVKVIDRACACLAGKAPSLHAEALLERAELRLAGSKNPDADLRQASNLIKRCGAVRLEWRVHHLRAKMAQGEKALRHYRQMTASIFSARLLTNSTSSRASYLLDKSEAISDFIFALTSKPTTARIKEALEVVRSSRSIALLEEILSASLSSNQDFQGRLESLREELSLATTQTLQNGASRRGHSDSTSLASLQRGWLEVTHDAQRLIAAKTPSHQDPGTVFVEGSDRIIALNRDSVITLPWTPKKLKDKLAWLRFELLAPMTDRTACADLAMDLLCEMRDAIWSPVANRAGRSPIISPDGQLWQVPWAALAALESTDELVLSAGSWSNQAGGQLPKDVSAMIWFDPLSELPHVRDEAAAFLRRFPKARVCTTLAEIRESLAESVDLLHVASHARFSGSNPLFSTLTFGQDRLSAMEVAKSGLRARQVVLSACETGTVSLQNRMEPEGLVRAFLARGAETVLASAWPLDDESACDFMDSFYVELLSGGSISASTSVARFQLRQKRPHPYFWGPFTLFGGYTS